MCTDRSVKRCFICSIKDTNTNIFPLHHAVQDAWVIWNKSPHYLKILQCLLRLKIKYLKVVYNVIIVADAFVIYHQLASKICHFYMRHLTPCRVVNISQCSAESQYFHIYCHEIQAEKTKCYYVQSTRLNIPKNFILQRLIHALQYHCWS
jgi:hypothetical protein